MTLVIDIGCARYGGDYSIERLLEEYRPSILIGFDPNPSDQGWQYPTLENGWTSEPEIRIERKAAWTYDGTIGYRADGLNSWVTELKGAPQVECVDIARVVAEEAADHLDVILKIDAEGSEYDLLRHLMVTGADQHVTLAVVEWHEPDRGRVLIEEHFAAPIKEWPY